MRRLYFLAFHAAEREFIAEVNALPIPAAFANRVASPIDEISIEADVAAARSGAANDGEFARRLSELMEYRLARRSAAERHGIGELAVQLVNAAAEMARFEGAAQ